MQQLVPFALAIAMVFAGMIVIALSALMNEGLEGRDQRLGTLLFGLAGNALLVVFAGVGTMIVWNRARQTLQANVSGTKESETDTSFFRTMSPSLLSGYVPKTRFDPGTQFDPPTAHGLLYLFAILTPGFGSLAGVLFMMSEKPGYQVAGKNCAKISVASLSILAMLTLLLCLAVIAANQE